MESKIGKDHTASDGRQSISSGERRQEPRMPLDSILMPFLGNRESGQGFFEFLLTDISTSGVGLIIPRWLVSREHLKQNDIVNLHLPFRLKGRYFTRGRVAWSRWDNAREAQACGLQMEPSIRPYYPVYIALKEAEVHVDLQDFTTADNLLYSLLKDLYFLKRGILIYLKHLVPFFYRIGNYPDQQYPELKETLLDDIRNQLKTNVEQLESLYHTAVKEQWSRHDIPRLLDLENLRGIVESEVQRDLLMSVFESGSIQPYLDAINELENKQNHLFNTIVMLYIQALSETTAP